MNECGPSDNPPDGRRRPLRRLSRNKIMRLPVIQGIIRRRLLVNFRIDPAVMQAQLPPRFSPKLPRIGRWKRSTSKRWSRAISPIRAAFLRAASTSTAHWPCGISPTNGTVRKISTCDLRRLRSRWRRKGVACDGGASLPSWGGGPVDLGWAVGALRQAALPSSG